MKNTPLSVCVIIPTLNRPDDIRRALTSLASQTHPVDEILVVDQSADDTTKNIVTEIKQRYSLRSLSYVFFPEKSLVKARNFGIRQTRSDVISFIDDDAELFPDYYEKIMEYFANEPDLGGLGGSVMYEKEPSGFKWILRQTILRFFLLSHWDGKMTASGFGYPIYERRVRKITPVQMLHGCNMNFRRSLIGQEKFDEGFTGYSFREDAEYCYRISLISKVQMVPDAKLYHHESVSNRLDVENLKRMQIENYYNVFKKHKYRGLFSKLLFVWSLCGILFTDFLEFLSHRNDLKLRKFRSGFAITWRILWQKDKKEAAVRASIDSPKISVVIPVYNGEAFVEKTIHSVLIQEYPAHEIIVIDDGSSDSSPAILARFGGKIKVHRIPNGGVANAMNVGIGHATGDMIAFLDHDDIWFRNKLRMQVEALRRFPGAGFVCSNYAFRPMSVDRRVIRYFTGLSSLKGFNFDEPVKNDPFSFLLKGNFVGTSSAVLVDKKVLEKAGEFNRRYKISGDYDYWLRCAVETNFIVMPEVLFYKRTHKTNISADLIQTLLEHLHILENFYTTHRVLLSSHRLENRCLLEIASVQYHLGNLYLKKGDVGQAMKFYRKGLFFYPSPANCGRFILHFLTTSLRVFRFNRIAGIFSSIRASKRAAKDPVRP